MMMKLKGDKEKRENEKETRAEHQSQQLRRANYHQVPRG